MFKLIITTAAVIVLGATSVFALTGIANTPHNLSTSQPDPTFNFAYSATNESEICIFCHTPHGGSLDAPLWNRNMPAASGYTHYTSATLTKAGVVAARNVNPQSLVCLSCHDGSLTVGDIINPSGPAPDNTNASLHKIVGMGTDPGARIGGSSSDITTTNDLSDDHPISISYSAMITALPGEFNPVVDVEGKGLTLYGVSAKNVECSTCHDPHVDYLDPAKSDLTPFLAMSNKNSQMCLACHIK